MEITITHALKSVNPKLALGVVEATVAVEKDSSALWREIDAKTIGIEKRYPLEKLVSVPEIAAIRGTYRQLGKDPSRYRGSAEALVRRVLQGKGLYRVNNVVDAGNLVSIKSLHPVGSYDLARIEAPVTFTIGEPGESYKGIGKEEVNIEGLPVFKDATGPYGSPTSDSERAMITKKTKRIMMVIISFTGTGLEEATRQAASLLKKYASADIHNIKIIS